MKEQQSKFLFIIVFIMILVSVALTYYKTIVLHDFVIIDDVEEEEIAEE